MNFVSLFKKTIKNLKRANVKFWIICLVAAALNSVYQTAQDSIKYIAYEAASQSSVIDSDYDAITGNLDNITVEEYISLLESYNDSDSELDSTLNSILNALGLEKSDTFKLVLAGIVSLFVMGLLIFIVSTIYTYLVYNSALESIEGDEYVKDNNLLSAMGAQLLSTFLIGVYILISAICITTSFTISPFISIIFMLLSISVFLYLAAKLSGVMYVYSKYKNLSATKIISKSFNLTKGKALKILGYNILIQILIATCTAPLAVLVQLFSGIGFITFIALSFIYNVVSSLLISAFLVMFNVTLFKKIDAINETNSDLNINYF